MRQDGIAAGLFYDPDENPGHAGLEIKDGDSYYPLDRRVLDRARPGLERAAHDDGGARRPRLMHTSYRVGPHLLVSEDIVYPTARRR